VANCILGSNRALVGGAVLAVLLLFSASLSGQTNALALASNLAGAGPDRPAVVPPRFVITPFGYFHPSCVIRIDTGETLLGDGRVKHANGSVDASAPACRYPHYTRAGVTVPADWRQEKVAREPLIRGWLESVQAITDTWYGGITATWTVPPEPPINDFQTIFFFPGFEDTINNLSIVEPVLQWYWPGPWTLASWNCCIAGTVMESRPVKASPGDTIYGAVVPMCKKGSGYCPDWKIVSENQTTGRKTAIRKAALEGQVWNWAFGAVLEVYGVKQCDDFPANNSVVFHVQLFDQNRNLIADPGWAGVPAPPDATPDCGYGLDVTTTRETLVY